MRSKINVIVSGRPGKQAVVAIMVPGAASGPKVAKAQTMSSDSIR